MKVVLDPPTDTVTIGKGDKKRLKSRGPRRQRWKATDTVQGQQVHGYGRKRMTAIRECERAASRIHTR